MNTCIHEKTELRYRRTNRAIQRQCLVCGSATTKALPYSEITVQQRHELPEWDAALSDNFWQARLLAQQLEIAGLWPARPNDSMVALPSTYQHTLFRSRLEARWAYYFDLIGCKWQYEPEGFALPHGNYCPDFLCSHGSSWSCYVEIKPSGEKLTGVKDKLRYLAMQTKLEVIGVVGPPTIEPQWVAYPDGDESGCNLAHAIFCAYAFRKWGRIYYSEEIDACCETEDEWEIARSLRFENGVACPAEHRVAT